MLVLSRKSRQSVVVGGCPDFPRTVRITVLEIQGRNVRLGIEADTEIAVHRGEVWERIHAAADPDGPAADVPVPDGG